MTEAVKEFDQLRRTLTQQSSLHRVQTGQKDEERANEEDEDDFVRSRSAFMTLNRLTF